MSTHRVYVDRELIAGDVGCTIVVEGDEARHAASVKRLTVGETVEVLDGLGAVASCVVEGIDPGKNKRPPMLRLVVRAVARAEPVRPRVRVLAPIPKADRLSWMIEQLSQVGAASWTPLTTARSVGMAADLRPDRLARIAREAAKQCGRAYTLVIDAPADLRTIDMGDLARAGGVLVADAGGERGGIDAGGTEAWSVFVGPEGGFAAEELARFEAAGVRGVALGPHVLRLETAAVVATAMLLRGARTDPGR
ncbi:MAG: RsmE family RNA methyltransferase [Phycisphaerales bacterium]